MPFSAYCGNNTTGGFVGSHGVAAFTMASTGILVMSPRMTRILLAGLLMVLDFTN
jgi:hypothetical protein